MDSIEAAGEMRELAIAPADAEALVALSAEAGWNQVAADWRLMLEQGGGVGIKDRGAWVSTALTFPLGARLSWISMVLTTKPWRGRGIGTRLLRGRVDALRNAGRAAGLDATELGRPIYAGLGFRELYTLRRWHLKQQPAEIAPPAGVEIRPMRPADLAAVCACDARCSALQRDHVLGHLCKRVPAMAHVAEGKAGNMGFVMGRDGRFATQIGPIVAEDEATALALASRAAHGADAPLLLDVPDRHRGIENWIAAAGGEAPRRFWRMLLGDAPGLDDARRVFALAGPELA